MNIQEYKKDIVEPTLKQFNLYSKDAAELVTATANHESGIFKYRRQLNVNPDGDVGGFGLGQIELLTHHDHYKNFLIYKKDLCQKIIDTFFNGINMSVEYFIENEIYHDKELLRYNDFYNCLMIRITYLRKTEPLPDSDDIYALADYWKRHYNTILGKGTIEKFVKDYNYSINLLD